MTISLEKVARTPDSVENVHNVNSRTVLLQLSLLLCLTAEGRLR